MQLIDKENDLTLGFSYLLEDSFEPLLELAAVFSAGDERAHIECKYVFVLQIVRNIPRHNSLGKAFDRSSLADTGLADQYRIVLALSGQYQDSLTNLIITADDRIQLLLSGLLHEVRSVFVQCVVCRFRVVTHDPLVASDSAERLKECIPRDAEAGKQLLHCSARIFQNGQVEVLDGHIFVPHGLCLILGLDQGFIEVRSYIRFAAAAHLDAGVKGVPDCIGIHLRLYIHLLDKLHNEAVFLLIQSIKKMFLFDFLVAEVVGDFFEVLNSLH